MFVTNYPSEKLRRRRILASFGRPRTVSIVPKDRLPLPGEELVHQHSVIMPALRPGKAMVIEWTGTSVARHDVDI
ncbi:MAG TPA: hypothetical protein VMM13_13235 [Euzebya sp.]|nr:hypothetical protein [Euzebya sp.]